MRALVVDDSRGMRSILRSQLRELGYLVDEAADGAEGLMLLQGRGVEVVFVDFAMPEMSGLEFLAAVRRQRRFDGVRLVMCGTEEELTGVRKVVGEADCVVKPFEKGAVRAVLGDGALGEAA